MSTLQIKYFLVNATLRKMKTMHKVESLKCARHKNKTIVL